MNERFTGWTKLRAMAEAVVNKAAAGDLSAFAMVADRLDGRPVQQSEAKVETDASQLFLEILREMQKERIKRTTKLDHCNDGQDQPAPVRPAATAAPSTGSWLIQYEAEEQQAVGLDR